MEAPQWVTIIGNLGGVALFAWVVYRLLERSMAKIEKSMDRQALAEERSSEALGAIKAELSALRAHMMDVAGTVAEITPAQGTRASRLRGIRRDDP